MIMILDNSMYLNTWNFKIFCVIFSLYICLQQNHTRVLLEGKSEVIEFRIRIEYVTKYLVNFELFVLKLPVEIIIGYLIISKFIITNHLNQTNYWEGKPRFKKSFRLNF